MCPERHVVDMAHINRPLVRGWLLLLDPAVVDMAHINRPLVRGWLLLLDPAVVDMAHINRPLVRGWLLLLDPASVTNRSNYKYNCNFSSTGRSRVKFCTKLRLGMLHLHVEAWLDIGTINPIRPADV